MLRDDPRVTNLVVLPGAAQDPVGDAIACDVAREGASDVVNTLRTLGIDEAGSIAIQTVDAAPTENAQRAEAAAPGSPDDGVVWDIVHTRAEDDARDSWSYYTFLTLATALATIAVIEDSPILVVGAMVVGPEFGLVVAIGFGLALRNVRLSLRALRLLAQGFALAIGFAVVLGLLFRWAGWIDHRTLTGARSQTSFIYHPDHWSLIVALLAGIAGVLSQTTGRATALVGVFISVTTVPAAGNLALGLALWEPPEINGSLAQLGINIAGMSVAGFVTLLVLGAGRAKARAATSPTTQTKRGAGSTARVDESADPGGVRAWVAARRRS